MCPYITDSDKEILADRHEPPLTPGHLTYRIQQEIKSYLEVEGEVTYRGIAEVLGCLEGAKIDFINRVVNPYEEQKIEENGDVW